jgi:hypothetical protein
MNLLTPIPCTTFGNALDTLLEARSLGLQASYHPGGGDTALFQKPVTHTVWVTGDETTINTLENKHEQTV